ncbi:alkanesulfonate monooxygenase SsuD/methylene tetrahydromethanopterin reductase-like flavin-dependent oxidoreductase (luciferase family) [Amycolatopsis bartoniae]|uniref:Luciferase n=1 Tax=Amycolatopsis bartoniae TaxID=941986 RepID=A0A8H9J4B9_9PSEU|nr:LLM class flavin-dependent oxidoreductase [Amycolatopsis bartoniae]MBB2939363.1 alkanesulfonate monooxygenase SsuD/methylene tetrahydromethanopterin reductase-like flavin-dependent oxidoreductase (luciferase family) [Amycolatopsis bartoniae]TVT06714.1 LLM class flavin-dependent oxidoreductase [Amycolatopsis bartoniae]GHF83582.1 luciferase [Amycolatopsis bartoniae]
MKIGITLPNLTGETREIPRWAAAAEEAGFATLGTAGRFAYPAVSDTVSLAAAAAVTERIELVSHILIAPSWPAALLAKEVAGIDAVSGGRLTLGIGVGVRPDDFVVPGHGVDGRGKRLDADLHLYRSVWRGEPVAHGENPAVPAGTRQIPLLFGAQSEPALRRAAREGEGVIGPTVPAAMVGSVFDAARAAWSAAGRTSPPRLVGLAYFGFGDVEQSRAAVRDYYSSHTLTAPVADMVADSVSVGATEVRKTVQVFQDMGADDLVFLPTEGGIDALARLAGAVL